MYPPPHDMCPPPHIHETSTHPTHPTHLRQPTQLTMCVCVCVCVCVYVCVCVCVCVKQATSGTTGRWSLMRWLLTLRKRSPRALSAR